MKTGFKKSDFVVWICCRGSRFLTTGKKGKTSSLRVSGRGLSPVSEGGVTEGCRQVKKVIEGRQMVGQAST